MCPHNLILILIFARLEIVLFIWGELTLRLIPVDLIAHGCTIVANRGALTRIIVRLIHESHVDMRIIQGDFPLRVVILCNCLGLLLFKLIHSVVNELVLGRNPFIIFHVRA